MKLLMASLFMMSAVAMADSKPTAKPAMITVETAIAAAAPSAPVVPLPETAPKPEVPAYLETVLHIVESMPVVGPFLVTVAKWLGVLASALTLLVTAIMGLIKLLQPLLNMAKLTSIAGMLEAFMNGPIMYWLKFASIYNAKKADKSGPVK